MISLDVGCGDKPRGSINIDLRKPVQKIKNFALVDTHYLPFRDNSFSTVTCFHVLEHCRNPHRVLMEIKRVSKSYIKILVPSKYHTDRGEEHIYSWNQNTLRNLLNLIFENIQVGYTNRVFFKRGRKLSFLNGLLLRCGFCREILGICKKNMEGNSTE